MTTPILDFAALTAPLPGDQPAGVRLPMDARKKMEDARKEFEANPDNPSAAPIPKKPDWSGIIKVATENLSKTSKDLLAAVRLVEALGKREGFTGLREGMQLLRLLVTECWDRIHPVIEEPDDIEARAGPFQWLADADSGAWFPSTIRQFPLMLINGQVACLQDCQTGKLGDKPLTKDAIKSAEPATPTTMTDVAECLADLATLDQALGEKMGDQAPALMTLRDVLGQCQTFLGYIPAPIAAESPKAVSEGKGAMAEERGQKPTAPASRAEAYRQLALLADELSLLEPHSPIPDLLRWAVKLGNLPFRQLILEFVQEPNVLADIRRRLGIKDAEPTK